jgi:glutaminyl-peptide cyclotransferase
MVTRNTRFFTFSSFVILFVALVVWLVFFADRPDNPFNGQRAFKDVVVQVSLGPRIPGSVAHAQAISYIRRELEKVGWNVHIQATNWLGFSIQNVIAYRSESNPSIIVGAHYDSRLLADQDIGPGRTMPVPGANDGASGVAVLLELARSLPIDSIPVWLVFFDGEDNGDLDSRQWVMGSKAFVSLLTVKPKTAVIVDMVGDANLNIFEERNSNPILTAEIWGQADKLGFSKYFIATPKYDMIDDHTPFLEAGIQAVEIIDFDYPYWHTTADTVNKISATSLQAVGKTLWAWIESK